MPIAYVLNAIANTVSNAHASLNTLAEIATAINNDPVFATTITTLTGAKQSKITATLPLALSASNVLTIDLSNYATLTNLSTAVANLVGSAPATLDTLKELAPALNNDPAFATTIATLIGSKQAQITATLPLTLSASNTLTVDLSTYYTKSQVDNLISGAQANLGTTSNLNISTLTTQGANAIKRV